MPDAPTSPPPATLRWVLTAARANEVLGVERLTGGWTSAMHAVHVRRDGEERSLVLRRMFREPWRTHAEGLLGREAATLRLLEATWEPLLAGLARMLVAIHRIAPGAGERPRTYQSWAAPERRVVPAWARDERVWKRAFSVIAADPPSWQGRFLHRDYHPGNVLFAGEAVSGVVDWVETSWGPADLDVAHCCTSLALLEGPQAAARMRAAYRAAGGELAGDGAERRYWELLDALGFLPDPEKVALPWRESGRPDITDALARERFEAYVAGLVAAR